MDLSLARFIALLKRLRDEAVQDRVTGLAAEVAFFGVLSVFPGLLMVVAAIGSVEVFVGSDLALQSKRQIIGFLNLVLTDEASGAIDAVENLFEGGSSGVLTVATLVALAGLSRAFSVVVAALNLAYDSGERRSWIKRRALGLALALGTVFSAVFLLVLIVVGPLFGRGDELAGLFGATDLFDSAWSLLRWPVAFTLLVAWATTVFHFAPYRSRARWRDDLPGAVVTAILWLVVSTGLHLYLRVAGGANPIYSVLGGGLILLIWIYLLSLSLLLGGELNPILSKRRVLVTTAAAEPSET